MGRAGEGACDVGAIVARIGLLFERALGSTPSPPAQVEEALADGYACLVALEAERARIARRSADLFAVGGAARTAARELRGLNAQLLTRDLDIARLRSLLVELREFAARAGVAG